jgi:carbon-monoxide dehydrogenase small subunit
VRVELRVNGRVWEGDVEARTILADLLRDQLGLTGTHLGCEQGVCGACTVLLDGRAVRSCLLLAVQAGGCALTTVEGLGGDALTEVQRQFLARGAFQCGFCTPGFLMLAAGALEAEPDMSDEDLKHVLSSNLCRCTGYQNILKAVRAAAAEMKKRAK